MAGVWQWCGSGVAVVWLGCGSGVAGVCQWCGWGVADCPTVAVPTCFFDFTLDYCERRMEYGNNNGNAHYVLEVMAFEFGTGY